jgi:hypothetical protein
MLADENDEMKSGAGDPGETMNMGSGESAGASMEPPQEKKPGDWVTVEMPKAPRPASSPPPAASTPTPSAPPQSDSERTMLEGSGGTPKSPAPAYTPSASQSGPTGSSSFGGSSQPGMVGTPPMQDSGSQGMGWMANLGIKDPRTQKIVLGVVGGAIFLCCACACLTFIVPLVLNSGSGSFAP